jgi:hypothetical protein
MRLLERVMIVNDDVLKWCKEYKGEPFHALLCDPPYALHFMNKPWDDDIAFRSETWAALAEHLYDGAFIMAFASARGFHRMAVAMEDAGLIMHPFIGYCYGSGFPKATRIKGNEAFEGHRYGLQALKPAVESIIIASKPLSNEPIYDIIIVTLILEVLLCLTCNVQDAEKSTNQLHGLLYQVVGNFVHGRVGGKGLLGDVRFVAKNSGVNRATMASFVHGNALTKEEIRDLLNAIQIGKAEVLSQWAIAISDEVQSMLLNIERYWNELLEESYQITNTPTTSMATNLITDLKICASLLYQNILVNTIQLNEQVGKMSFVQDVETLLASLVAKLRLHKNTTVIENVTEELANQELDQVESQKDGIKLEPILVFQKPYKGKPIECITRTGAGSLNIDGGRIGTDSHIVHGIEAGKFQPTGGEAIKDYYNVEGRWPANLILSHTSECKQIGVKKVQSNARIDKGNKQEVLMTQVPATKQGTSWGNPDSTETVPDWDCPDYCPVRRLGEQSGNNTGAFAPVHRGHNGKSTGIYGDYAQKGDDGKTFRGDTGTASRFFFNTDWELENTDPLFYCAKSSRSERDAGLESMSDKIGGAMQGTNDQTLLTGSGNIRNNVMKNNHPTVKPLKLTQYLATLLLPPKEYAPRRILIPFAGVMSEAIGAMLAGWEEIVAIEQEEEYCKIGQARLDYWETRQLTLRE